MSPMSMSSGPLSSSLESYGVLLSPPKHSAPTVGSSTESGAM